MRHVFGRLRYVFGRLRYVFGRLRYVFAIPVGSGLGFELVPVGFGLGFELEPVGFQFGLGLGFVLVSAWVPNWCQLGLGLVVFDWGRLGLGIGAGWFRLGRFLLGSA